MTSSHYSLFLASAYVVFNGACLIAYFPQVLKLIQSSQARCDVVLTMWITWTFGAAIELLYAMDIGNAPWMWMAAGHLVACVVIASLGIWGQAHKRLTRFYASQATHPKTEMDQSISV